MVGGEGAGAVEVAPAGLEGPLGRCPGADRATLRNRGHANERSKKAEDGFHKVGSAASRAGKVPGLRGERIFVVTSLSPGRRAV